MQKQTVRPRSGGGFTSGMGSFGEHMDENAMTQAMGQKQLSQLGAHPATAMQGVANQKAQQQQQKPPRSVGTLKDELITRPVGDFFEELKQFFSLHAWLGIEPASSKDPAEQARQQQAIKRYQQLNEEQQAYARQKYQAELQKKKQEEEENMQKKQAEEQRKRDSIQMPSSPKKGPVGPAGSKKQKAAQKLHQDRKQLSGPGSAN
ncbi:MAG: hypothetical protein H6774_02740 [Pseudomonadales bacterium]|nr:hypothetical protein [Candidatus Woesebacteria bacterium]MCB9801982.1 hypothetical protein [Pseudomonadales bacterium]